MEINLYATLRPIVGQKTIEFELKPGANAKDLIEAPVAKYPSMDPELLDKNRRFLPIGGNLRKGPAIDLTT